MKNTKEIESILTALYCINFSGARDSDIHNLVDYAFNRLFGANTNLITLACIGRTKDELMPEITKVLKQDTQYHEYFERIKRMKLNPRKIYTVLVDWVNDSGESDFKSFLYSTKEKAKEHFKKECLSEIEAHRGEEIFIFEESDKDFTQELLNQFDDDFNHVCEEHLSDFVIDCTQTCFSCYKQGEYACDHFNVRIVEQIIDAIQEEKPCDHFNARPIDTDGWQECHTCHKLLDADGNVLGDACDYEEIKFKSKESK